MKLPHKVLGIIFLCLLLAGVWFTQAIFNKQFTKYDEVTLLTSRIGLQLPERADVKIRGVIVGEVLDFQPAEGGAKITLGMYPDLIDTIPENVSGSVVPKTLFGEKYIALDIPQAPREEHLHAGDIIRRTELSIEVEQVLSDLYPLLRTVAPADLNRTLTAIATALEGRGNKIGDSIETLDSYLKRVNPQIPDLIEDLRLTTRTADIYSDLMPQIAEILRNTVKTGNTLEGREAKLRALFSDVSAFSDTARSFLDANGDNIIRLGQLSEAQTAVLAKYAPEYPCLLKGLVNQSKLEASAFRGFMLHINLETIPHQPRGYGVQDMPVYGAKNGPQCGGLPNPPGTQAHPFKNVPNLDDGIEQPTGKGTRRVAPTWGAGGTAWGDGLVGSPQESSVLKSVLGPALGLEAADVPDLGPLLIGPMARGAEVELR